MREIFVLVFFIILAMLIGSCCSASRGNGSLVSDLTERSSEYRAIQGEIREGESSLAVAGAAIELRSEYLASGISELEQSLVASQGAEPSIGEILQRVRSRRVPDNLAAEYANQRTENEK